MFLRFLRGGGSVSIMQCLLLTLLTLMLPCLTTAFLGRGTLLEHQGDIFDLYCSDFDRNVRVWHHREITREAVRRVMVNYFKEVAPAKGTYNHRDGMTLEEAFEEYYGTAYSPKPFLDAVSKLVDAVAEADTGVLGADPRYHFGNERFSESQMMLAGRWRRMVTAGLAGDYEAARTLLGLSLAAIQDFYSHTNWVELGNKNFNRDVGITGKDFRNVAEPREETCEDCPEAAGGSGSCRDNILEVIVQQDKLTSGYTEDVWVDGARVGKPSGVDKCSHGGPKDRSRGAGARGGINKDLPTSCFSPHSSLHQEAAEQAVEATEYYLTLLRLSLSTPVFARLLGLHPTPALVVVLDTTESMAQELKVLTRTFARLAEQHTLADYPPSEYLLVPFNDPLYGPVVRSEHPEDIYQALRQLRTGGGGDEAELSMSALRLALHHAPPYSHVFLFTDAPIKDLELFEPVVTLARSKAIKVTPVITLPVSFGRMAAREELGVHSLLDDLVAEHITDTIRKEEEAELLKMTSNKSNNNSRRRPKRQVRNYSKYEELAERTGGLAVRTTRDKVEEVARMMEVEQYPAAVLWRAEDLSTSQRVSIPVDSLVREIEVSVSGGVTSATLSSPSGAVFDLMAQTNDGDPKGYTLVVSTPYFLQTRIDLTQRQEDRGDWTLSFIPRETCSVVVSARTKMDILPVFYLPDTRAFQPSLQRVNDQPSQDLDSYLDMVITGVDRAGLRQVDGARLLDRSGSEAAVKLPTSSPRRNTYLSLPTRDLPQERFTVALVGKDSSGQRFRRESVASWERVESMMSFPLGRDIWGPPGSVLKVPVTVTNTDTSTGTTNTFFLTAHDAFGSPVTLDQSQVTLGQNETATVVATMFVDPQTPPRTTNSLVVSASSPRGDTSHARAHVSITPRDAETNAPTCEVLTKEPCSSTSLSTTTCTQYRWSVRFITRDDTGVFDVKSEPSYTFSNFVSGSTEVILKYEASCCNPEVTIQVRDMNENIGICTIYNGDLDTLTDPEDAAKLSTAAITGISIGTILLVLIIVAVVIIFVIRHRRSQKEDVTVRRTRRLSME